jgi:hypothetical protein
MSDFYRAIRVFAVVTLFFFCWTYLPLYAAVAYAATPQTTGPMKQNLAASFKGQERPEAQFEKALEDIRQTVEKAGEKTDKGEDVSAEIEKIKTKRAEIESLDANFKKEFSATEKKLKDAKLPKEILDRHYKFVKHYEDNLKELKTNLDDVEQAKTKSDRKAKIEKAKLHLEKVKPQKKHVPVDPNMLPNRMVKAKARKPRINKEDFEKEFVPQGNQKTLKTADSQWLKLSKNDWTQVKHKSILLAYNGSMSDLSLPIGAESAIPSPSFSFALASPLMFAQATTIQPSPDDLSETPEIQFTQDIQNLAAQLNYNPVQIYNWVRNNIEYAPTYGSIQGAEMCLQSTICNDMDTASLLIALLRVSGISSHYVYGTIDVPINQAMNWVGGVTNPQMAGTILATNGIPATNLISGGTISTVQLEHVWVKAFIDYIPSRGAVQRQGNTWIPLDASMKQYTYTQGIDIQSTVPFDAQSFANQIQSTATISPDGSVTNVNSALVQQTMQNYQIQVQNYIQQNYPYATVGNIIGQKAILQQNYPILLGTLPYKTDQVGLEFSSVSNLQETMSFSIPDPTGASTGLIYTTSMSQIAGNKVTLSFSPATANDVAVIESFLPQLGSDGPATDPSQISSSVPAYLINLVPELRINGQLVATGAAVTMGSAQPFNISLNEPGIGVSNINKNIMAGEYYGIGVDTGKIGSSNINSLTAEIQATMASLTSQDVVARDNIVGDILYTTISAYFAELDASDETLAKAAGIIRYRAPSVGTFSVSLAVQSVFGIPTSANPGGLIMDVNRIMQAVFSNDGTMDKVKQYMTTSGVTSSALEHSVPEQLYSTATSSVDSVSAIKALQLANDQGIPIYTITQSNINAILPQLTIYDAAKNDVINAVNSGKSVIIQKSNISYAGWNGCGYIILDPNTGAGAYMISSGVNGSSTNVDTSLWSIFDWFFLIFDLQFWGMGKAVEQVAEPLIGVIAQKIGLLGVFVGFISDANHVFNDPNLTTAQTWAIGLASLGFACAAAALVLASGGLLGIILGIAATVLFNWLKETLIEEILNPVPLV